MKRNIIYVSLALFTLACKPASKTHKAPIHGSVPYRCAEHNYAVKAYEISRNVPSPGYFRMYGKWQTDSVSAVRADTVRCSMLVTFAKRGFAQSYEGYCIVENGSVIGFLYDDKTRQIKDPAKVWKHVLYNQSTVIND